MNPFYSRYRNKTKRELESILENEGHYTKEALEAASHLLKLEDYKNHIEVLEDKNPSIRKKKSVSAYHEIREYLKGFRKGQLFTLISLTLLYWSIFEVFYLYSNERAFGAILYPILIILLPSVFIINHVFFRVEVTKNTFWGRVVSTLFLLTLMILFRMAYQAFIDGDIKYEFNFFGFIGIVIVVVLSSIVFELIVSLINGFLKIIGWPQL